MWPRHAVRVKSMSLREAAECLAERSSKQGKSQTYLQGPEQDLEKFRHGTSNVVKSVNRARRRLSFVDRTCDRVRPSCT